jgi:multiple sugar transport system ATP-binding protein
VTLIESTGSLTYIVLGTEPELTLVEQGRERVKPGDRLRVEIRPELVHLFDPSTGKRI